MPTLFPLLLTGIPPKKWTRVYAASSEFRENVERAVVEVNRGLQIHMKLGNFTNAIGILGGALEIAEKIGSGLGQAVALTNLGTCHWALGNAWGWPTSIPASLWCRTRWRLWVEPMLASAWDTQADTQATAPERRHNE